jgi:hypothetical protein
MYFILTNCYGIIRTCSFTKINDMEIYVLLSPFFCFIYPWVHNFFRYIGEKIFKDETNQIQYLWFVNILYFPIFPLVFYLFTWGDYSLISGWEYFKSGEMDGGRLIGVFLIIVLPVIVFLASITYGITCLYRIRYPQTIINSQYD